MPQRKYIPWSTRFRLLKPILLQLGWMLRRDWDNFRGSIKNFCTPRRAEDLLPLAGGEQGTNEYHLKKYLNSHEIGCAMFFDIYRYSLNVQRKDLKRAKAAYEEYLRHSSLTHHEPEILFRNALYTELLANEAVKEKWMLPEVLTQSRLVDATTRCPYITRIEYQLIEHHYEGKLISRLLHCDVFLGDVPTDEHVAPRYEIMGFMSPGINEPVSYTGGVGPSR